MSPLDPSEFPPRPLHVRLARQLHPRRLIPTLIAALVIGLLQVFLAVSFAALVFAGELSPFLARGVGFALFGAVVTGFLLAVFSSLPGMVGGAQDIPAAILAVIGASVVGALGATSSADERFATVVATIMLTTVVTGALLFALGFFRLGNLVRFLPHPVVGGFLAGTGWLLVTGALGLMAGVAPGLRGLPSLLSPATLSLWLPGFVFAVLLLVVVGRFDHVLVLPGMIVGAFATFYTVVALRGGRLAELGAAGWLLGPFPEGGLWQPLAWREFQHVDAGVMMGQLPAIASVALVSAVAVLLNAGGLEVATRRDVDLNRELRSAGIANLAAGAGGGLVGFQMLSLSLLGIQLGSSSRVVGLLAAGITCAALVFGASFLGLFPTFLLGGLLMFLGLGLLKEWIVDAWFGLPRPDYVLVLGILVTIAAAGFLVGVAVGLLAAVVLFAVEYGRLDVVRHERTGAHVASRVTRTPRERELLQQQSGALLALELQGFLFFGTSERLLQRVRRHLDRAHGSGLRYLLLDFRRVTGSDATAALSFLKMLRLASARGVALMLTDVPPAVRDRFVVGGVTPAQGAEYVADLDRGLERCEDDLLRIAGVTATENRGLEEHLSVLVPGEPALPVVLQYFERRVLEPGERLAEQGAPADHVYLVESGSLTAQLERPGTDAVRLETVGGGQVLGELGFFLREPRSASLVVDTPSVVHALSWEAFERMKRLDPAAALALHGLIARLLSVRVRHLMGVVDVLEQ